MSLFDVNHVHMRASFRQGLTLSTKQKTSWVSDTL